MTSRLYVSAALLALACATQSVTFGAASDAQSLYQQAIKVQNGQGTEINLKAAQDLLEKAAVGGSAMAMQRLGDMYHDGDGGVAKDYAKAVEWYQKEAALDDSHPGSGALGMLALAGSYEHGHGVTADKAQVDALYAKALKSGQSGAAKGDTVAMIALAYCLAEGKGGIKADPVNAWQWAIKSSETPNPWAYEIMASMYSQGAGVPQDDSAALRNTLLAAQMGLSQDMVNMSLCYANGIGVKKDPVVAVEWIRKAVERGNGRAMGILGKYYHEGIGIDRSDMTAREWYQKAVDLGDPAALGYMGDLLIAPGVNPRDSITAASWFDKGAKAGDASSMFQLAELLIYDNQVPRDVNRAVSLLMEASNLGFGDAMDAMGELYRDRILTPGTQADAMTWFRRAAAAGSAVGMRNLAEMLSYQAEGPSPRSDDDDQAMFAEAVSWLKKAAALGDLEAVTDMGDAYLRGKGVALSATTAVTWYRKAADAGNVRAMRSLGKIYAENNILADYKEAFNWYTKAANYGDPPSISGLAQLYDDALGTKEDNATAYRLYSQAAELGDAGGYWGLGRFLQEGQFVPQDLPRAASFYQVAANGGDIRAMEALGRMYELGSGVPKDLNRAMALFKKAADFGSLSAINWVFSHTATSTAPWMQGGTNSGAGAPGSSTNFPAQPGGGNRDGGGGGARGG